MRWLTIRLRSQPHSRQRLKTENRSRWTSLPRIWGLLSGKEWGRPSPRKSMMIHKPVRPLLSELVPAWASFWDWHFSNGENSNFVTTRPLTQSTTPRFGEERTRQCSQGT